MGLRTASVGCPNAPKDMAPALTEPKAPKAFELPRDSSPINKTKQLPSYQAKPTRRKRVLKSQGASGKSKAAEESEKHIIKSPLHSPIQNEAAKIEAPQEALNFEDSLSAYTIFKPSHNTSFEEHNFSPPTKLRKPSQDPLSPINTDDLSTQFNLEELNSFAKKPLLEQFLTQNSGASDNHLFTQNMSESSANQELPKMGLQKTEPLTNNLNNKNNKTPNDIDQLFDANVEDIMQQMMKHIDGDQLNNSASDLNEVLDLNLDKELLENIDMNMSIDDQQEDELETAKKIKENQAKSILSDLQKRHARIERRLDFLRRRASKLQSRYMGQQISGEVSGVFEHVQRTIKQKRAADQTSSFSSALAASDSSDEILKPMSIHTAKSLAKKLEAATLLQANTAAKQRTLSKYFGSGSVESSPALIRGAVTNVLSIPNWSNPHRQELQKVSEQLHTQLRVVQKVLDSEATESSSGGESCDEMQVYSNPHQQYLSIQKRALWRYSQDRAAIASRWTWLQSQISDLEYRIREHTQLHKQIRKDKGSVLLAPDSSPPSTEAKPEETCAASTVNGYKGQLPGATPSVSTKNLDGEIECLHCARTRPLSSGFRKRKLLQVPGLHAVSKKAARPSTIRCSCIPPGTSCALCTGRTDPTYPRDHPDALGKREKVSRLDPAFHPVLSLPEDSSQSLHLEAIMKMSEWQNRSSRIKTVKGLSKESRSEFKSSLESRSSHKDHKYKKKKYKYKIKPGTASALSEKIKKKLRGRKRKYKKRDRDSDGKIIKDYTTVSSNSQQEDHEDAEVEATMNSSGTRTPARTRTPILPEQSRASFDSPGGSPLLQMQSISGLNNRQHRNSRVDSYDIDNIVIPYSVAAATRVEKLQYKEILTPKWRIAEADYPDVSKPKEPVPDFSVEDSDAEDVSEESIAVRHERSEQEERKKFLSYLKLPFGVSRQRSHKRQDSMAESSGGNTPDPMSPHPPPGLDAPPESPAPPNSGVGGSQGGAIGFEDGPLPSIAMIRRRTISQSRMKEVKEEPGPPPDFVEAPPYESRTFPLPSPEYDGMVKEMPETHRSHQTNTRAQDFGSGYATNFDTKSVDSGDTESTESAIGEDCYEMEEEEDEMEDVEDPNDPEWIDVENATREKHHHHHRR